MLHPTAEVCLATSVHASSALHGAYAPAKPYHCSCWIGLCWIMVPACCRLRCSRKRLMDEIRLKGVRLALGCVHSCFSDLRGVCAHLLLTTLSETA